MEGGNLSEDKNLHSSFVPNGQKLEPTQISFINGEMDKSIVVYSSSKIQNQMNRDPRLGTGMLVHKSRYIGSG